jgi:hypothetical protein
VIASVLIPIAIGLLVNELCDVSPWLARRLVRWSAFRRYADPARAEARAEELAAVINARPGQLFKLTTTAGFAISAATVASLREGRTRRESNDPAAFGGADGAVPCRSECPDRAAVCTRGASATAAQARRPILRPSPCGEGA